jgi:glycosyltransferase involved in cell wall biosynthesis
LTIVLVPSTSEASGVVTYVAALARAIDELGCACLTQPGSDLDAALPSTCERLPTGPGRAAMASALRKARGRGAFVQTHGARSLLAARMAGLPRDRLGHLFHEPADQQGLRGAVEWRLARGVELAANAPGTAEWVERRLGRPAAVLTPIVEAAEVLPRAEARRLLGIAPSEPLVIGVVGRLAAVKSPELAVLAAARLAPRRSLVVFVGAGPESAGLQRLAETVDVPILLAGPHAEAARLLSAFDVVAVPSRHETFGLSLAEAMAARIPVAAVDSPGARAVTGAAGPELPGATDVELASAIVAALEEDAGVLAERAEAVLAAFGPGAGRARAIDYFSAALRPRAG